MPVRTGGLVFDHPSKVEKIKFTISSEMKSKGKSALKHPVTGAIPATDEQLLDPIILGASALASSVSIATPTPLDQGGEGACVTFSMGYYNRSIWEKKFKGQSSFSNSLNTFSPEFLYDQTKFGTDCGSGTAYATVLDFMTNNGICLYNTLPYSSVNGCASSLITNSQKAEAVNFKVGGYSYVAATDRAAIKTLLSQGIPVSFTVLADNGWQNTTDPNYIWSAANHTSGNLPHAICCVGYDDSKNAYRIVNSWGTDWCDGGYGWIDYDWFEAGIIAGTQQYYITSINDSGSSNIPPTASAGGNHSIQLPTSQVSLVGSGTDPDGTIMSYAWTQVSGPNTGSITTASASSTTVTGLVAGTYQFKLTVTDNGGLTGTDISVVTVSPANVSPISNAGTDKAVTLPTSSVTLIGSGTDPDGTVVAYAWTRISGPNTPTIVSPSSSTTSVTGLVAGTYVFRLTVTDNQAATGTDDVSVVVSVAANVAPTAGAGIDQTIQSPTSSVNLSGTATDSDGTIASTLWTQISGPNTATITSASSLSTSVTGLVPGTYQFKLTATDDDGASGSDIMVVTVLPVNQSPSVNAGIDQTLTSPVTFTSLSGSAVDPDGSISSKVWTQTAGASATITNATTYTPDISGLSVGSYTFRLTATDNQGATGFDEMNIVVKAQTISPVANAGFDQVIPSGGTAILDGSASFDSDGTIFSWNWTKISGPSSPSIDNSTSPVATVTISTAGTYVYQLVVTDNDGNTGFDTVTIVVNTIPTDTATLTVTKTTSKGKVTDKLVWDISLTSAPISASIEKQNGSFVTFYNIVPYTSQASYSYLVGKSNTPTRFYRLKVVKSDGSILYSTTVSIH